jgi:hypothetical protein
MSVKRRKSGGARRGVAAVAAALLLLVAAGLAGAQEARSAAGGSRSGRGPNEIGLWGGGSVASATMIGRWTDFDFGMLAVRYASEIWRDGDFALDWTVDGVPLALISLDRGGQPGQSNGPKQVVYGAGLAPIGLRVDYDGFGWWRPYFATNVGFLMFTERVPATGTKFNYTWDFGLGAQLFVAADQALTLGYDFKHISNAYSGEDNPGFDANLFYIGYSIFR